MQTTVTIDDDVLAEVQQLAAIESKTVGEVISTLTRQALHPANAKYKYRNGVPLLASRHTDIPITSELVRQLDEELE